MKKIKNKKYKKILLFLLVNVLFISGSVHAKYILQYQFDVAMIKIDGTKQENENDVFEVDAGISINNNVENIDNNIDNNIDIVNDFISFTYE